MGQVALIARVCALESSYIERACDVVGLHVSMADLAAKFFS